MPGTISVPVGTKPLHEKFVNWLNGMLNNYEHGFWDYTVENMMKFSFITSHSCFMQEMFQRDGFEENGYILVGALTTPTPQLLYFDNSGGNPIFHNSDSVHTMFEFSTTGRLNRFYANVSLPLYDKFGATQYVARIDYNNRYGILLPMIIIQDGQGRVVAEGIVDTLYEGRFSGTYEVTNKPLEELPRFLVQNVTGAKLKLEVPMIKGLTVSYEIAAHQAVQVPITPLSEFFFEQAKELTSITYKRI